MSQIHAIVNPAGRDGSVGKRWPKILAQMEAAGLKVEATMTERVNHAAEIAWNLRGLYADQPSDERPLVVAVGGDGTVHEVASGLRGGNLVLGIIPHGTGNDYARGHGYRCHNRDSQEWPRPFLPGLQNRGLCHACGREIPLSIQPSMGW